MNTFKLLERVKIPGVVDRSSREASGFTTDRDLPIVVWQYVIDKIENLPTEAYPRQVAYVVGVGIYVVSPSGWVFNEISTNAINKSKKIHFWDKSIKKWVIVDSIDKIKE